MLKLITKAKEPDKVYPPFKPSPPQRYLRYSRRIPFKYGHEYSLKELKTLLPEGIHLSDVRIKYTSSDNGCDTSEYLTVYYIENILNKEYESQLALYDKAIERYNKAYSDYESKKEAYISDLKEYFAWRDSNCYNDTNYEIDLKKKYNIE